VVGQTHLVFLVGSSVSHVHNIGIEI